MKKKILFIKKGTFSNTNFSVAAQLERVFPEYELEVLDIVVLLRQRYKIVGLLNVFHTLRCYGKELILGRKKWGDIKKLYFSTPYLFHRIKRIVALHVAGREQRIAFTFQTQCYYDASVAGIPHYLYTDHTLHTNLQYPGYSFSQHQRSPAYMRLEQKIYDNARMSFFMSQNVADTLPTFHNIPPHRTACVKVGSNIKVEHYGSDEKYTNKNILFVGIEWERKGGPVLLDAFKQVLRQHPDATLSIVGCRPKVAVPRCKIYGRVPREDMARFYQEASVFCMPTLREPFGIVFIEAMLYKLPVVAGRLGAIPEFVKDQANGILTNNSAHETAIALNFLLSHPEVSRTFGQRGEEIARNNYTYDLVGDRMREHIVRTQSSLPVEETIRHQTEYSSISAS